MFSGTFVQVLNSNTSCLNDTTVYECTAGSEGFLIWDIIFNGIPRASASYSLSGGADDQISRIGLSVIKAELAFRNNTFISSTLTITGVSHIQEYVLLCNREELRISESILSIYSGIILTIIRYNSKQYN